MEVVKFTARDVRRTYRRHMRFDFPKEERKPLKYILMSMREGTYEPFGLVDGGELLGYAFFVTTGGHWLLDYLAIVRDRRGMGYGTKLLSMLRETLADTDSVIAEAENPDFAADEAERTKRLRRLAFYARSGFADTTVRSTTFGVEYVVIEMDLHGLHTPDEVRDIFLAHYKNILPGTLFEKEIHTHS